MGKIKYAGKSSAKIRQACKFYGQFDPDLEIRALKTIVGSLHKLLTNPKVGRPWVQNLDYRERVIEFGKSHFLALYHHDEKTGDIIVVGLRHERERSYGLEDDN